MSRRTRPGVAIVAARGRNGVIGRDGGLPWRLAGDLRHFRAVTLGKPVIMGRRTWDSLPRRPLPGRTNLVLSRDGAFAPAGAVAGERWDDLLAIAREQAAEDGAAEVCVIGGAALFALALPRADRLYLTEVAAEPPGDVLLPPFDEEAFREIARDDFPPGPDDAYAYSIRVLERTPRLFSAGRPSS